MSSHSGDAWIDEQLKNVPVPGALLQKLHAIASLDDAELDHALCDVATPTDLLNRLRSIGSLNNADIDDELRHILTPITLADRLRRIPSAMRRNVHRTIVVRRLAIAASLLVAAFIGYVAAVSPLFFGRSRQPAGPRSTIATRTDAVRPGSAAGRSGAAGTNDEETNAVELANTNRRDAKTRHDEQFEQPQNESAGSGRSDVAADESADQSREDSVGPDQPDFAGVFTGGVGPDWVPPLENMSAPVWRGVPPPRDRGYNWLFQLQHGVHPFVAPSAGPALETCPVPLVTSTASFEAALEATAKNKRPEPRRVRTEDFLAAMDYGFPLPESRPIGIRTAIGPSPWGAPGTSLLQVAAQAQVVSRGSQDGSHLVVVLDASASMRWENRWQNALQGLTQYAQNMQPADYLTVVVMGERAARIVQRESREGALEALKTLADQPSARAVNAAEALQLAGDAAGRWQVDRPRRIVLITDGALQLNEQSRQQFESLLRAPRNDGYGFEVFDLRHEEAIDGELDQLVKSAADARAGSGVVKHVSEASDVRWRLLEVVTGKSQLVATKATMKVKFKPEAVVRYRLIGHEFPIAGLVSPSIEADLRSGEAATGLFEVILKPDGGDTIATVEVAWEDPKTGEKQTRQQTISRLQIAPSFYQAPLSLQLAALSAETAEILRGSYFAPSNAHSLASVAELGGQLNARLRSRPSFERLMTLIEQAQRSH